MSDWVLPHMVSSEAGESSGALKRGADREGKTTGGPGGV